MLEFLAPNRGRVVGLRARETVTAADYADVQPRLEAIIVEQGPLRLLVDMTEFEGWDLGGAWKDFVFGLKHWNDFERLALVGDGALESWAARIGDALTRGEVRTFQSDEMDAAWKWIEEGLDLD